MPSAKFRFTKKHADSFSFLGEAKFIHESNCSFRDINDKVLRINRLYKKQGKSHRFKAMEAPGGSSIVLVEAQGRKI